MLVYPFIFTHVKGTKFFENVFEKRALMYLRLIISIFYGNWLQQWPKLSKLNCQMNITQVGWMQMAIIYCHMNRIH